MFLYNQTSEVVLLSAAMLAKDYLSTKVTLIISVTVHNRCRDGARFAKV